MSAYQQSKGEVMLPVLKQTLAVLLAVAVMSPSPAQSVEKSDEASIADAYVYLLGRALVDRQEKTDIA
jgi:hypothetical protein